MAAVISDFAVETAYAAPSTGTVSLGGALSGLKTLVTALGTGVVIRYAMFTATKNKWEKGYGTLTTGSPSTLTRTLIDSSTGSLIDWQPGDLPIYIAPIVSGDEVASMRSNFRGATAPTAPLQLGMVWADTTGGVTSVAWKICTATAASGTWVTLYTVNETTNKWVVAEDKGADMASAATTDLSTATGNFVDITGTVTITALGTAKAGSRRVVRFTGSLTLTHNSTSLILIGGKSIVTTAGDRAEFWSLGSGNWLNTDYQRANVLPAESGGPGAIWGLTYANNGTDNLDIAAGGCMDATGVYWIKVAALTKQSNVAWAVGNNAGGLDTGAVGNSDYYIWAIARSDTGVTDILYSLSSTAPTMPASYDYKRLIGWFKRSGGAVVAFKTFETAGGGLEFKWTVTRLDVNVANTLTTTRRTDALSVPLNISTTALIRAVGFDASAPFYATICDPGETDAAPSGSAVPGATLSGLSLGQGTAVEVAVRTSSTGTVASRASIATVDNYIIVNLGFIWSRR